MRRLVILSLALASLTMPLTMYSQFCCDPILDPFCEDCDIIEEDIILEEDDYNDWAYELDEDYVYSNEEGPISPDYPPSIIDTGVYTTQVSINTEYLEDQGVDQVSIL